MSEIVRDGDTTVVRPGIDIVASMAEDFKRELFSAINDNPGDLVIDLAGVEMVDSVGIGVIIATHNTLEQAGRTLKVINVSKDVFGLFSTMRLNRRFTIESNA
ncbi:predicted anti-sigma factor antagonist RsbV (Anti-anti-sigma-B factor) [Desulforapulum autotrophicum HRM2]|uniref:Predicted anti-sigma factor antagonist RsbV (Anti-anti-sigma-B factor) n=1 Tax=Desulforapulum autotrophicum (strain ATCC 43914 / DSM 3382 / VKM B-1955 / HRM2) TaxID=177437 RepID=C0QGS7_DESAH|nr:STAS domain-containing protein [Desulforapulum autotrophicum]ACN13552.1 predicted anti-sigma factor antagonist RsbV (Anti-anti-sigma-B factor) [Desulforapulum autotrophicum HRM2]